MKKLIYGVLALCSVVAYATPSSAQYYGGYGYAPPPPPPPYYYGKPKYYGGYYARKRNPCRPGWTIQSGVCKPYRGY